MFTCVGQAARSKYCRRQEAASQIGMGQSVARMERERNPGSLSCRQVAKSASEKLSDRRGDLVAVSFERKVAGVEEVHVCVRYVAFERLGARRQEERVVLAPSCQKRRLVLAKIGLEFGIQRDVALVVAEQVELHFIGARSCEIEVVERIPVRRNRGR